MKKFTALFLVFSLMMLSTNLYAKERRGAKLIITKKDGQQVEGELITVKPTSLLLLNTDGKDESVDIADIRIIRIVKKSKIWIGAAIGLFIVGGMGAVVVNSPGWYSEFLTKSDAILFFGYLGTGIGALLGIIEGRDKKIELRGMTESEIQETLDKLRKKARVRNYK